jgi:hypothetical protein
MIRSFRNRYRVRAILIVALVLALSLLAGVLFPALAQGPDGEEVPTVDAFLQFIASGGVAAAVAVLLSFLVENWAGYEALAPRFKRYIYGALCFVVPVGAVLLRWAFGYVPLTLDPLIWHALWYGAGAFGVGTAVHGLKLSRYPSAFPTKARRA